VERSFWGDVALRYPPYGEKLKWIRNFI